MVSSGLGKEGHLEGTKMAEYLLMKGVSNQDIIIDNNGYNTRASVANTSALSDSLSVRSVKVISQFYHISRSKMLYRKAGFKNVSSAAPKYFELRDVYALIREVPAYYLQLLEK